MDINKDSVISWSEFWVTTNTIAMYNASLTGDNWNVTSDDFMSLVNDQLMTSFFDINSDSWITYEEYIDALSALNDFDYYSNADGEVTYEDL